jgi:hypothetical protein
MAKIKIKDLKASKKQLSKEEADAVKGGAVRRLRALVTEKPLRISKVSDATQTTADPLEIDLKSD